MTQDRPVNPWPAPKRPSSKPRLPAETALLIALAANVLVVLAPTHFPYQDWVNHLARYQLMLRAWEGTGPSYYQLVLIPTPYIGLDLLGMAVVGALGPAAAMRALALALAALPPLGLYLLLRAVAPEQRGWAVAGALLTFNSYYLVGNVSYVAGVGLALTWLSLWWPRRERCGPLAAAGLVGSLALLTLVHLSAPVIILGVVGLDTVLYLSRVWRGGAASALAGRSALPLAAVVAVGLMLLWIGSAAPDAPPGGFPTLYRSFPDKARQLAYPIYSLSKLQLAVLGSGYAASLLGFVLTRGIRPADLARNTFGVAAAAFVLLYFVTPTSVQAAGEIDVRWLLPALLFPWAVTAARPAPPPRLILALPLAASLAHAAVVWSESRRIDARLAGVDRVLAQVPEGSRVFPVVANPRATNPLNPFRYYTLWLVIRGQARTSGLFSLAPTCDGCPLTFHMAHFREVGELYFPPETWVVPPFASIRWDRVHREYDYLLQMGTDREMGDLLSRHGEEMARDGEATLYRLRPGA